MRVILFGAPGSGKGTQGDLITKRYGFPRISTGDLLRRAVQDRTSLGKKAEGLMKAGKLVSDEIVEELVRERISAADCRKGYILDGFPRTIAQAKALERIDGRRPEIVIGIEVRPEILFSRLTGRWVCPTCQAVYSHGVRAPRHHGLCDICRSELVQRADDKPEVIRERIRVYEEETAKLKDYYLRQNTYRPVDGEGGVEDIFKKIVGILDAEAVKEEEGRITR